MNINNNLQEDLIIYKSTNLVLEIKKQKISLLRSNNGHFKTLNDEFIGNIVQGYTYKKEGKSIIEPIYSQVVQVFPDGET
jgi:hypothetical protein